MKSNVCFFLFAGHPWNSMKKPHRHFQLPCKLLMVRMNENQTNLEFNLNREIRMKEKKEEKNQLGRNSSRFFVANHLAWLMWQPGNEENSSECVWSRVHCLRNKSASE